MTGVEKFYHNGLPLHLSKPEDSVFKILQFSTFNGLSALDLQTIFRTQNILVTGCPTEPTQFDEAAMEFIAGPPSPITIHGAMVLCDVQF